MLALTDAPGMTQAEVDRLDDVKIVWEDEFDRQPPPRPGRIMRADEFTALYLLPSAPPEVVRAAHKALAQMHHPDKGGDLRVMQVVNAAFDTIVKEAAR